MAQAVISKPYSNALKRYLGIVGYGLAPSLLLCRYIFSLEHSLHLPSCYGITFLTLLCIYHFPSIGSH